MFRIPDGGKVKIDYPDRSFIAPCEYIDDYHTRISGEVYHICQFAEILERGDGKASPEPELLKDQAAWQVGHREYLSIHATDDGWDYSIYDKSFAEVDGGQIGLEKEIFDKYLFSKGFRYRINVRTLPGCPDIVLPKYKTVIFVNGCFWHKHDCPRFVWPSSNEDYWIPKIQRNVERDEMNTRHLMSLGWNVLVVWECQLKKKAFEHTMSQLESDIRKGTEKHE